MAVGLGGGDRGEGVGVFVKAGEEGGIVCRDVVCETGGGEEDVGVSVVVGGGGERGGVKCCMGRGSGGVVGVVDAGQRLWLLGTSATGGVRSHARVPRGVARV